MESLIRFNIIKISLNPIMRFHNMINQQRNFYVSCVDYVGLMNFFRSGEFLHLTECTAILPVIIIITNK